jgi:hypothetical protein
VVHAPSEISDTFSPHCPICRYRMTRSSLSPNLLS